MSTDNKSFETVAALLRSTLFGAKLSLPQQVDWKKALNTAVAHNVAAVVAETVKSLPKGVKPEFEILLQWEVYSEMIRQNSLKRRKALSHLSELFSAEGIKIIVFKGESLARLYPVSENRECGDVDIILPETYDKGNSIIEAQGIKISYGNGRHSVFKFDGVTFENHVQELKSRSFMAYDKRVQEYVVKSLDSAALMWNCIYCLEPRAAVVFQICHLLRHVHYKETNTLRSLCDFALLLNSNKGILDDKEVDSILEETGLKKFLAVVLAVIERILGVRVEWKNRVKSNSFLERIFVNGYVKITKRGLLATMFQDFTKSLFEPLTHGERKEYRKEMLKRYSKGISLSRDFVKRK